MTITVVGTQTENSGDSTTFTVAVPTVGGGILAGDYIVVAAMHCESEDNTWGVPPGMDGEWLSELQVGQTPPSIPGTQVFFELCEGGESGSRSSVGTFVGSWNVVAWLLRGADTVTPLDVAVTTVQSTSDGDPNPPSITPVNDDCAIIAVGFKDQASTAGPQVVTTWPVGYTDLQVESNTNTTTGGILAVSMDILIGGAASPENPSAYVMSLGADQWAGATIAIRPAAAAVSYEQEGYQFRLDDGDEVGATDLGAQDSDISSVKEINRRLRILSDATGDPPSQDFTIEYRKVGDPDTEWRDTPLCVPVVPPAPTDPPALANLQYWYDFTDAATVFSDNPPTAQALDGEQILAVLNKGYEPQNIAMLVTLSGIVRLATNVVAGHQAAENDSGGTVALQSDSSSASGHTTGTTIAMIARLPETDIQLHTFQYDGEACNSLGTSPNRWILLAQGLGEIGAGKELVAGEWEWMYGAFADGDNDVRFFNTAEENLAGAYTAPGFSGITYSFGDGLPASHHAEAFMWDKKLDAAERAEFVAYVENKYPGIFVPAPPEEANLILWLDTTDPTTVFSDNPPTIQAVNNDPIEYIVNKGTDGASLDMDFWPDAPNFAILKTDVINGLQILGLDDEVTDNNILSVITGPGLTNNPNGATLAAVLRKQVLSDEFHGVAPGSANDFLIAGVLPNWLTECGNAGGKDTLKAQVANEWVWVYCTADSAGDCTWRASGASEQSDSGNPFSAAGLTNELVYFLNQGQTAECLYWDIELDATAKANLIAYFDAKYGTLPLSTPPDFVPPAFANVQHWFDITDPTTVFSDLACLIQAGDTDVVRCITNKGSSANFLDLTNTDVDLTLKTGNINGLQTLTATDFASINGTEIESSGVSGVTMAMVARVTSVDGNPGSNWSGGPRIAALITDDWHIYPPDLASFNSGKVVVVDEWVWGYGSFAQNDFKMRMSGATEVTDAVNDYIQITGSNSLFINCNFGDIAEVIIWDTALDASQLTALIAYFDAKYGVLPA